MNQPKSGVYLLCAIIFLVGAIATFFILRNNTRYIISIVELAAFLTMILLWNQKRLS
jgi:hypothetical protein